MILLIGDFIYQAKGGRAGNIFASNPIAGILQVPEIAKMVPARFPGFTQPPVFFLS